MVELSRKYQSELAKVKINRDVHQAYQQQQQVQQQQGYNQIPTTYLPPLGQSPKKKPHTQLGVKPGKRSQQLQESTSSLGLEEDEDD